MRGYDDKGFNPHREFFSQLPYEHIDPLTGNLLLTHTDLVLPGNAGFELRILRTYNSKNYTACNGQGTRVLHPDSWAGLGWTFHLGRVISYSGSPAIEMPDGSVHNTFPHIDQSARYISREFWIYEKKFPAHTLKMANGVVYTFGRFIGDQIYVTKIEDPFRNQVTVNYVNSAGPFDGIESVEQRLLGPGGGYQVRTLKFTYDTARKSLKTMTLGPLPGVGPTWTYTQVPINSTDQLYTLLTEVRPPAGVSWKYTYNTTQIPL